MNEKAVLNGLLVLQKVNRRLSQFNMDHKLFKAFVFNGVEHQMTLTNHAQTLMDHLRRIGSKLSEQYGEALLDESGQLIFQPKREPPVKVVTTPIDPESFAPEGINAKV